MAESSLLAFAPIGQTVNIAVTASAQQFYIPGAPGANQVRIVNSGTTLVFILFGAGGSAQVATATNAMAMLAGTVEVFTLPANGLQLSVIAGATGSTLYATAGAGQ